MGQSRNAKERIFNILLFIVCIAGYVSYANMAANAAPYLAAGQLFVALGFLTIGLDLMRVAFSPLLSPNTVQIWSRCAEFTYYFLGAVSVILYFAADDMNRHAASEKLREVQLIGEVAHLESSETNLIKEYGDIEDHKSATIRAAISSAATISLASNAGCIELSRWVRYAALMRGDRGAFQIDVSRNPYALMLTDNKFKRTLSDLFPHNEELALLYWHRCYIKGQAAKFLLSLTRGLPDRFRSSILANHIFRQLQEGEVDTIKKNMETVSAHLDPELSKALPSFQIYNQRTQNLIELSSKREELNTLQNAPSRNPDEDHVYISFFRYKLWVYLALFAVSLKLSKSLRELISALFGPKQSS